MATIIYDSHIDLSKNQLLNAKLQNLTVAPTLTAADEGFIYYNTTLKQAMMWTGVEWIDLSQLYTHPTFSTGNVPASDLTGASVISAITINNGHVTSVKTRNLTATEIGAATTNHTHLYSDITGLPANTLLGNNTAAVGPAKALTASDLLTFMAIAKGTLALLNTGTDTADRTWRAVDLTAWLNTKLDAYLKVVDLAVTRTGTAVTVTNTAGSNAVLPAASATQAGVMIATDKSKLDNIEANANNYVHPNQNPGTHPFSTEQTSGLQVLSQMIVNNEGHVVTIKGRNLTAADIAAVMIKDTLTATGTTWSSSKISSELQSAIAQAQTGALQYKGEYNPTTNTPPITTDASIKVGYTYVVSADGSFLGEGMEAGDMIIAKKDNPGSVLANWQTVNKNIPAIVNASTTARGIIQLATTAEGTTGTDNTKAITPLVLKAVLDARTGGYAANFGDGTSKTFTITHNLNTQDVSISVYRVSDRMEIMCERLASSANTVVINTNSSPAANAYRVVIKK